MYMVQIKLSTTLLRDKSPIVGHLPNYASVALHASFM